MSSNPSSTTGSSSNNNLRDVPSRPTPAMIKEEVDRLPERDQIYIFNSVATKVSVDDLARRFNVSREAILAVNHKGERYAIEHIALINRVIAMLEDRLPLLNLPENTIENLISIRDQVKKQCLPRDDDN